MSLSLTELRSYAHIAEHRPVLGSVAVSALFGTAGALSRPAAAGASPIFTAAAGRSVAMQNGPVFPFWTAKRDAHTGIPPRALELE